MRSTRSAPPCAEECERFIRDELAATCADLGVPVPDAHVTHVGLLIPPLYTDLNLRCPHGVLWHIQPTGEQIAEWAASDARPPWRRLRV